MRACVLLHCQEALFFWEDFPVVFFTLVIKTELNTVLVIGPAADHVVSGNIVYSPVHVCIFQRTSQEKAAVKRPLRVQLCFEVLQVIKASLPEEPQD